MPDLGVVGVASCDFDSWVTTDGFWFFVLAPVPSCILNRLNNENLREIDSGRAFFLISKLWLCLRGFENARPGSGWGGADVDVFAGAGDGDADAGGLMGSLPCSPVQWRTVENESFLCGRLTPSGLTFGSLVTVSFDMVARF